MAVEVSPEEQHQQPVRHIHNNSLIPVLHPVQLVPSHCTAGQLVQKDFVRDSVKNLIKIQKNHRHFG